jgi:hypothetical protein
MCGSIRPLPVYAFTVYTGQLYYLYLYHFRYTCAILGSVVITKRLLCVYRCAGLTVVL